MIPHGNKIIITLGFLPFVMVVGNSMFIPILPTIEKTMNLTSAQAGLILTVFTIPAAIVIPITGYIADKYGKKKTVLLSLLLVAIGSIMAGITFFIDYPSISYALLLSGRAIQGLGAGGTSPLAMAAASDLFQGIQRSKALGTIEVFNSFGKLISPFLGIFSVMLFWESAFLIYLFFSLVTFIAIHTYIKKDDQVNEVSLTKYGQTLKLVIKQKYKWLFPLYFFGGILLFILFGLQVYLSYELDTVYDVGGFLKGVVFAAPLGMMTLTSYFSGNLVGRSAQFLKYVVFIGMCLLILALIGGLLKHSFIMLLIILVVFSSGVGLLLPCCNYLVTTSVIDKERGIVVSLYGMIRFLGVALGPLIFSQWMFREWWMFMYSLLLLMTGILWLYWGWLSIKKQKSYSYHPA